MSFDLFVVFASTSTVIAPIGQADYVSANAFLNAFAEARAASGADHVRSINWGVWSEVGMAATAVEQREDAHTESLTWTATRNAHGAPGAQTVHSGKPGPITGGASGHGGLSPWVVRNTLVLSGSDFKARTRVEAPASLADVMPTVLTLLAVDGDRCEAGCGRVLEEALRASPNQSLRATHRTLTTSSGAYRATVQISSLGGYDYVDEGARRK